MYSMRKVGSFAPLLRFSLTGKFLGEVAKPGHGDGEMDTPHGLWLDFRGEKPLLVVADRGNRRMQTFTLDGAHLRTIKDEAHLRMPCNFHTQGEWMVCPDLDSQVCILDREFNVVAQLGDGKAENGEVGSRRGQSRSVATMSSELSSSICAMCRATDCGVTRYLSPSVVATFWASRWPLAQ